MMGIELLPQSNADKPYLQAPGSFSLRVLELLCVYKKGGNFPSR